MRGTTIDTVVKELQTDFESRLDAGAVDGEQAYAAMLPEWPAKLMTGCSYRMGETARKLRSGEPPTESEAEDNAARAVQQVGCNVCGKLSISCLLVVI